MNDNLYGKGLKRIPDYVASKLDKKLLSELAMDGFGLSFPCKSGCQMRLMRNKEDLGGFYSYEQFGGIKKAVTAAINKNRTLRALYAQNKESYGYVYFLTRFDKRKNKTEFRYQVSYSKQGKPATKNFSLGHKEPCADKCLHGYLTARMFRFYYETLGDSFDESCFKTWKEYRLYWQGNVPFDWDCE